MDVALSNFLVTRRSKTEDLAESKFRHVGTPETNNRNVLSIRFECRTRQALTIPIPCRLRLFLQVFSQTIEAEKNEKWSTSVKIRLRLASTTTNSKWHRSCWKRDVQLFLYAKQPEMFFFHLFAHEHFRLHSMHRRRFSPLRLQTFQQQKNKTDCRIEFSAMFRRRDQKPCDSKLFTFPSLIFRRSEFSSPALDFFSLAKAPRTRDERKKTEILQCFDLFHHFAHRIHKIYRYSWTIFLIAYVTSNKALLNGNNESPL